MSERRFSRRRFLRGSGIVGSTAALAGISGCISRLEYRRCEELPLFTVEDEELFRDVKTNGEKYGFRGVDISENSVTMEVRDYQQETDHEIEMGRGDEDTTYRQGTISWYLEGVNEEELSRDHFTIGFEDEAYCNTTSHIT